MYSKVKAGHCKSAKRIQGGFPIKSRSKHESIATTLEIASNGFRMSSKTVSGTRNLFEKVIETGR